MGVWRRSRDHRGRGYEHIHSAEVHNQYLSKKKMLKVMIRNGVTGRVELVTPPLDSGTVLPGVTRQSVLDLAAEIEGIDVVQRRITLPEVR